jgi:spore coat-associated protein N
MSAQVTPTGTAARLATVVAAAALMLLGFVGGSALPSAALLTAGSDVGESTVTSGSVALGLANGAAAGTWTGSISLVPGAAAYHRITVTNLGSVALRYAATATSTSDQLASRLAIGVVALAAGATSCDASSYAAGTPVSVTTALPFGSAAGTDVVGDPAAGAQDGDRVLAPSVAEDLCLQIAFPFGTQLGHAARGLTASTVVDFIAESTS